MVLKTKINKSEINQGQAKSYLVGDTMVVICNVDGNYFAIDDICSHDDGVLVSGEGKLIENCQIECPRHGARFDVKTGKPTRMPAVAPIRTYRVVDSGDELEINVE